MTIYTIFAKFFILIAKCRILPLFNCFLTLLETIVVSYDIINFFAESYCRKNRILYTVFEITVSKISGKPLSNNLLNAVKLHLNLMSMYIVTIYITLSFNRLARDNDLLGCFIFNRFLQYVQRFVVSLLVIDFFLENRLMLVHNRSWIENDNVDENWTIKSTSRLTFWPFLIPSVIELNLTVVCT